MYKTVRHGENSLQYTILPQQDDCTVGVRPRRGKKRGKTAAVLAITMILICGVIATAVLVPLLLTSDLVALPAAFQKFSVSSLRRTHSGNQMMVLAKKPHGWSPHHITQQPLTTTNSTMTTHDKETTTTTQTTTISTTTTTEAVTTSTTTARPTTVEAPAVIPSTSTLPEDGVRRFKDKMTEVSPGKAYVEVSTTTTVSHPRDLLGDGMIVFLDTSVHSTSSPAWSWPFQDPAAYFHWTHYSPNDNLLLPIMLVGALVSMLTMITVIVWLKRRRSSRNRNLMERASDDSQTGDKANLLKETAETEEE